MAVEGGYLLKGVFCETCGRAMAKHSKPAGRQRYRCIKCNTTTTYRLDSSGQPVERCGNATTAKTTTLYDADGEVKLQWVKDDGEEGKLEAMREAAAEVASLVPSTRIATPAPVAAGEDKLAVFPLGDVHFGMLAWAPECGEDYDCKIAAQRLLWAMQYLMNKDCGSDCALILGMGDFLHADDSSGLTPRGKNKLDVDGRWQLVVRRAIVALTGVVDLALKRYQKVRFVWKMGNHDPHSGAMLGEIIKAWYRNEPRVSIEVDAARRSYIAFGENLLGVTHGETIQEGKLPLMMAAEEPAMWGNARFRHIFKGHLHQSTVQEYPGCVVETVRAACPRDSFGAGAYLSRSALSKVVFHRTRGEVWRMSFGFDWRERRNER